MIVQREKLIFYWPKVSKKTTNLLFFQKLSFPMILSDNPKYDIIVITGPTASGKTALAVALATVIGGEIVSADSRQVYRRMI